MKPLYAARQNQRRAAGKASGVMEGGPGGGGWEGLTLLASLLLAIRQTVTGTATAENKVCMLCPRDNQTSDLPPTNSSTITSLHLFAKKWRCFLYICSFHNKQPLSLQLFHKKQPLTETE